MRFNIQISLNIAFFLCGIMEKLGLELENSRQSAFLCIWQDSTLRQHDETEKKALKWSYQTFVVKGRLNVKKTLSFDYNFLNSIQRFQDYLILFWNFWQVKRKIFSDINLNQ